MFDENGNRIQGALDGGGGEGYLNAEKCLLENPIEVRTYICKNHSLGQANCELETEQQIDLAKKTSQVIKLHNPIYKGKSVSNEHLSQLDITTNEDGAGTIHLNAVPRK